MSKRSIIHCEFPAQNREDAAKFYTEMFGWPAQHVTEPSPYTMLETGNVGVGVPDISEQYKAGDVVVYIESNDVAADLKKIEELGGKALSPAFDVGEMGTMAFFADPSGNRLALWHTKQQS